MNIEFDKNEDYTSFTERLRRKTKTKTNNNKFRPILKLSVLNKIYIGRDIPIVLVLVILLNGSP